MTCSCCAPFIERKIDDRERSELTDNFDILEETVDKYDSCTMWWYGKARCKSCGQKFDFEYRSGFQNFGKLVPLA
jgi:hypothetical protein